MMSWCLMSSDVIWHIRDKLWPMPKHRFNKIHIRKVYACLAVTCHLHFWQNDRDFLRATVVTRGWNGYRNKSQHRKSTLEKKILPPFQQGFEPATFQSRVRCSNHWAIPAPRTGKEHFLFLCLLHGPTVVLLRYSYIWNKFRLDQKNVTRRTANKEEGTENNPWPCNYAVPNTTAFSRRLLGFAQSAVWATTGK